MSVINTQLTLALNQAKLLSSIQGLQVWVQTK